MKGNSILILIIVIFKIVFISTSEKNIKTPNPIEINELFKREFNRKIIVNINEKDPINYLKLKNEIMDLYAAKKVRNQIKKFPNKHNLITSFKKKLQNNGAHNDQLFGFQRFLETNSGSKVSILPMEIGQIGNPINREYYSDEELVPIFKADADSIYIKYKGDEIIEKFEPNNVLTSQSFWCSTGNHGLKDEIKFNIEFERSFRMNAMWINWAFAPGEFKITFSNDKKKFFDLFGGYRHSIKDGNINWWKSILSNTKTRWKYKSFDERIVFSEPIWGKYVEITMKVPVNQYYGIYKVEFYTKNKSIVMIKSLKPSENICITVGNGLNKNFSPVIASECLQVISYGDNRDLWVLNSNGYISSFKDGKCIESPTESTVDLVDCGLAADYKDEREKWILDYDGKIRSSKQQFTCLTLGDDSIGDLISFEDLKCSASSTQNDNLHECQTALDSDINSFWASNPSKNQVIYEIYLPKYPYVIKNMEIQWKFPAKKFYVIGLLIDGYWKKFLKMENNRETNSVISLLNFDIMGIKIVMQDSTTKFEDLSIYGIKGINFHTGSTYLRREPCKPILNQANLWKIIDISFTDTVSGEEHNRGWAQLDKTRTKFKIIITFYKKIPEALLRMKEKASFLRKNLIDLFTNFKNIQLRLLRFEDFLKSEKMHIFGLATNKYFPAKDCASIIIAYPSKRNGFYWIKNECTPKPIRVYCDFYSYKNKGGLDYFIYNRNNEVNTRMYSFKNYKDIRAECAQLGLEPIQIKNLRILKIVHYLLKKLKYNLKENVIIPIGYDYNCDISKCSGNYKSLNDENSYEINQFLESFSFHSESNNLISKNAFEDNGEQVRNVAGFGINDIIVYLKLEDYPISAIVCSTNKYKSNKSNDHIEIECDTNLRGDVFSDYELYTNLRVVCPQNCASDSSLLYGDGIYTDNSSICKAAIHSGLVKDSEGGIIDIVLEAGKKNYIGKSNHNIESLDYSEEWDRSYRVKQYKPNCPIDKVKEIVQTKPLSSFMSIEENIDLKEREKIVIENDKTISNDELMKEFYSFLKFKKKAQKLTQNSGSNFFQLSNLGKNNHKENSIYRINNSINNYIPNSSEINNNSSSITTQKISEKKEDDLKAFSSSEIELTTEDAIISLSSKKSTELKTIKNINIIASELKTLIGKVVSNTNILLSDKELGMTNQISVYNSIENKINNVKKKLFEIDRKSKQKVSTTENSLLKAKYEIDLFLYSDQFIEDYSNSNILDNYIVFNSLKGHGSQARWEYYNYNLNGHYKTISQKGGFIDSKSGSHLIVKNRNLYDFEARISVLIQDNKTFGVAFRYKDPYNYYIFEISNEDKGFKRIRKFVKGNPSIIDVKYSGGYLVNTWYNIKIFAQNSNFLIYITDQKENIEKRYEKVFDFNDNELLQGTLAFTSLGNSFLLIDNISIIPISCTNFDERDENTQIISSPTCSRFFEDFKNDFTSRWQVIDPLETKKGPSDWSRFYNIDEREIVLGQMSKIRGISQHEEGTIFLLNKSTKLCKKGKFSVKFKAKSNGIIGFVFRYVDGDFYIVEISGEKEKFLRFRQKIQSSYEIISTMPLIGYDINKWYSVIVYMNDDKFNLYMTKNNIFDDHVKIFSSDIFNSELKSGLVGLSTYKTSAYFSEISLQPFDNLDEQNELLYVDDENLDCKFCLIKVPKKKLNSVISNIRMNYENFSWGKCLIHPDPNDRIIQCNILFQNKLDLKLCKVNKFIIKSNFCKTCCNSFVDSTNKLMNHLCNKQCKTMEKANDKNKSWKTCYQPKEADSSVYPYCDKLFEKDFFQKSRCKIDFCNLCCVSYDKIGKANLSVNNLMKCYENCTSSNNLNNCSF